MFRRLAGWAVVILAMSSCAITTGPGLAMKKLPANRHWCSRQPPPLLDPASDGGTPTSVPGQVFSGCWRKLRVEMQAYDNVDWSGSVIFGLDTNDAGLITSLCFYGGSMGDTVDFAECAADALERSGYVFSPNLQQEPYWLTFVFE